jgi:hypothetical protein
MADSRVVSVFPSPEEPKPVPLWVCPRDRDGVVGSYSLHDVCSFRDARFSSAEKAKLDARSLETLLLKHGYLIPEGTEDPPKHKPRVLHVGNDNIATCLQWEGDHIKCGRATASTLNRSASHPKFGCTAGSSLRMTCPSSCRA